MTTTATASSAIPAARRFRALADDTRLRILELLQDGERCVCELIDVVGARQSLLSFHLKALKDAGLVQDERRGRWVYYSIDSAGLQEAMTLLAALAGPGREVPGRCA